MSILFGNVRRGKRQVVIVTDKLLVHCCAMNRLIEECVSGKEYNTAISLLKNEIETIERKIDDENNAMTK